MVGVCLYEWEAYQGHPRHIQPVRNVAASGVPVTGELLEVSFQSLLSIANAYMRTDIRFAVGRLCLLVQAIEPTRQGDDLGEFCGML